MKILTIDNFEKFLYIIKKSENCYKILNSKKLLKFKKLIRKILLIINRSNIIIYN